MKDYSELKKLAEALIDLNRKNLMDWAAAVEDARIGKTHTEYALSANPADVLALIAEVERLTADNSSLRGSCAKIGVEHAGMVRIHRKANTEIRRLSAEVEALRKDAERYRWLREKVGVDLIFGDYSPWLLSCNTDMTDLEKKTTDAAIDAAMSNKE